MPRSSSAGAGLRTRIAELLLRHSDQRIVLAARDRSRLKTAAARLAQGAGSVMVEPAAVVQPDSEIRLYRHP
jgi:hypothetical protein